MPQSLSRILVHLIFSTQDRVPALTNPLRAEVHRYLAGILHNLGCISLCIGGPADHVHLLFALARESDIAKTVRVLKSNSSKWINGQSADLRHFQWQKGYAAFSVSASHTDALVRYIGNQEEHHRRVTFQEELLKILQRAGVAYDERYLWD